MVTVMIGRCVGLLSPLTTNPLDEMGQRVDELEKNITDLMQQVESREETSDKKQ